MQFVAPFQRGHDAAARMLVGHILEEMHEPMSREIQVRAQEEATAHLRSA